MGKNTGIEWAEHTFNIAWGCEKISPGCKVCYAQTLSSRFGFDVFGKDKPRRVFGEKHVAGPAIPESVQAKLSVMVRRVLRKHRNPPDTQQKATLATLEQAEALCRNWVQA